MASLPKLLALLAAAVYCSVDDSSAPAIGHRSARHGKWNQQQSTLPRRVSTLRKQLERLVAISLEGVHHC